MPVDPGSRNEAAPSNVSAASSGEDSHITIFQDVSDKPIEGMESDLRDLLKTVSELALDLNLDPGLLKDIPVVRTAAGVVSLVGRVRDALFVFKLRKVFQSSSAEQRQKLSDRLKSDESFARKAVEKFLLLIDRVADMAKCELLGKVIAAFAEEKIDQDTMMRLFDAIDRLFILDLPIFKNFYVLEGSTKEFIQENQESLQNLVMCGLISSTYRGSGTTLGDPAFRKNPLGSSLFAVIENEQRPSGGGEL